MELLRFAGAQFARPSGAAGELAALFMSVMNRRQYGGVERALSGIRTGNLLELGFGSGRLIGAFAGRKPGCTLYGIELSEDMLRSARRRNAVPVREGRMLLRLGDAASLPYREGFFRGAYTVNTVYFWKDPERCFRELQRVLTPGGVFVNAFYGERWLARVPSTAWTYSKFEPAELERLARRAGFSRVRTTTLKRDTSYCMEAVK